MPRLSANAKRQLKLTAEAERVLHAAAFKHYKATTKRGDEVTSIEFLEPGTRLTIEWADPRPDSEVLQPAGPSSGTATVVYHDGPSLAIEMHAIASFHDSDNSLHRGLWLRAAVEKTPHFFWSMIINFHAVGKCFPPMQPRFLATDPKLSPAIYMKEVMKAVRQLDGDLPPAQLGTSYASVAKAVDSMQMASMGVSERDFPGPCLNREAIFAWQASHEEHWATGLKAYIDGTANPPCPWVLAGGCDAGGQCPCDREGPKRTNALVQRMLNQPLAQQEVEKEGTAVAVRMLSNGAACSNPDCESHAHLVDESLLRRCSRCHNTTYCNPECQKGHWKRHKPECRERSLQPRTEGNVWCLVLPPEGRRPYAALLPVEGYMAGIEELVGGNVHLQPPGQADHLDLDGVRIAYRVDEAASSSAIPSLPAQSLPVNERVSAILTPSEKSGSWYTKASVVVSGKDARCRGTAVALRVAGGDSLLDAPPIDFGKDDFNDRWGIFTAVAAGVNAAGDQLKCCYLTSNTPENCDRLTDVVMHSGQGRRRR